jgi:hypothetical protein
MKFTKRQTEYLKSRIDNICNMMQEDPDRNFWAIVASTGLTFQDDLRELKEFAKAYNKKVFKLLSK